MLNDADDMSCYRRSLIVVQSQMTEFEQLAEALSLEENWEVAFVDTCICFSTF